MEKLENEGKTLEEEFLEEWEQDVPDWHEFEEASWAVKHTRFAWFLNFLFVAVPYGVFDLFMQLWNVYTNMVDNKFWVGGNLLLVSNTVISLIQGVESFFLMAEFSTFLENMKLFRSMSLIIAFAYNLIWLLAAFLLYSMTHSMGNSVIDLMIALFTAYNLLFNAPIMMINFVIIMKELLLESRLKKRYERNEITRLEQ